LPMPLAHPDLAIAKPFVRSRWLLGTRGAHVAAGADTVPNIAASVITLNRDDLPDVRFLVASGDPRDALDYGVDLIVTRDPATLDYAATLPQFQFVPLPWHRTHVLLAPGGAPSPLSVSEEAHGRLAREAVRGEARGAQGPFWWRKWPECGIPVSRAPRQRTQIPRIVYDASDPVARDLAERFVGLARATYQRAAGLSRDEFAVALGRGADAGYILSVEHRPLDPCRELQIMLESAQWIDSETIVPLVDTRLQAIVRRGRSGVSVEWDGGLRIGGPKGPSKQ
jgi:hypothetical protein